MSVWLKQLCELRWAINDSSICTCVKCLSVSGWWGYCQALQSRTCVFSVCVIVRLLSIVTSVLRAVLRCWVNAFMLPLWLISREHVRSCKQLKQCWEKVMNGRSKLLTGFHLACKCIYWYSCGLSSVHIWLCDSFDVQTWENLISYM